MINTSIIYGALSAAALQRLRSNAEDTVANKSLRNKRRVAENSEVAEPQSKTETVSLGAEEPKWCKICHDAEPVVLSRDVGGGWICSLCSTRRDLEP